MSKLDGWYMWVSANKPYCLPAYIEDLTFSEAVLDAERIFGCHSSEIELKEWQDMLGE